MRSVARKSRILAAGLGCCLAAMLVGAQTLDGGYELTVQANRADAHYHRGEAATFTVTLNRAGREMNGAEIEAVISKDGVAPRPVQRLRTDHGHASLTAKLDEPGFLQCCVTFRPDGGTPLLARAGVAIEPQAIRPGATLPDDFGDFWAAQKQSLALIPPNLRLTLRPAPGPAAKIECFDLRADAIGAQVSGYLARPVGARPGSLPAILLVHGAGVSSSRLSEAVRWAKAGMLALDLNAHGLPNGLPAATYAVLGRTALKDYWFRGRESREGYYFLGVFLRLVRALDALTLQPEWDGRVLVVHGYSQGGAQALVAAGLDPRVTFYAAGIPAMCDHSGLLVGQVSGWPKLIPSDEAGQPDKRVVATANYYDAVNFARQITAPGIISTGFIDTACPPTSVYAAYNVLSAPKRMLDYPSLGHAHPAEMETAMREAILEHVASIRAAQPLPAKIP